MNTVNIEVLSLNFFSKTLNGGTFSAEAALSSGTAFKQKVFVLPSLDQSLIWKSQGQQLHSAASTFMISHRTKSAIDTEEQVGLT